MILSRRSTIQLRALFVCLRADFFEAEPACRSVTVSMTWRVFLVLWQCEALASAASSQPHGVFGTKLQATLARYRASHALRSESPRAS